jgi:membrane protease YdiL (CAAX protease family)
MINNYNWFLVLQQANGAQALLLILGFLDAVLLRMAIGGVNIAQSIFAGLFFAGCLLLLSVSAGLKISINRKILAVGFIGGLFLVFPTVLSHRTGMTPAGNYIVWAAAVSIVALAEEAFFRGVLFDSVQKIKGEKTAVVVAALAFAALHIPIYGWHVLPLDFSVGIFLGCLRLASGSWVAPGFAHTIADLAGWWLM